MRSLLLSVLVLGTNGLLTSARGSLYLDGEKLPSDFVFGCATAAYQVEGAWNADGKGESIWDVFVREPGKIAGNATGDVANDFYHRYASDLELYKKAIGPSAYDFTMAWTRILPQGRGTPNQKGIEFYRNVIKTTHSVGMTATCTLYHWDLPRSLYDEYKGWLSPKVVDDFREYARVMFEEFGDECDHWVTMNEPKTFCTEGYGPNPDFAPGVAGPKEDQLMCVHYALLAHAAAVEVYRKAGHKAPIGIKADVSPNVPLDPTSKADRDAALRANDFEVGWIVLPLTTGDYPSVMKQAYGSSLPSFTSSQSKLLKGSIDFLGMDAYTSAWATPTTGCNSTSDTYPACVDETQQKDDVDGSVIGRPTASSWNFLTPENTVVGGMKLVHERYGVKVPLWISETGQGVPNEVGLPRNQQVYDADRVDWYRATLKALKQAIKQGLAVGGFVPWSCIDNMEWADGYTIRFGLIGIEYDANGEGSQKRYAKKSARYLNAVFNEGKPIDPYYP